MKKRRFPWTRIVVAGMFLVLLVFCGLMYGKMSELSNQFSYLQDSTSIILSDVSGMQSNIEKTLEEEASMVEQYSIHVVDMDFASKKYTVDISIIPKEYTDKTKVSIFFGTIECELEQEGYAFRGSVKLPFAKSFDGNVTVLIANGKKKTTEVFTDYTGPQNGLQKVLSGRMEKIPTVKDGTLRVKSKVVYALDGGTAFDFEQFALVAELDGEEIQTLDLMPEITGQVQDEAGKQLADTQSTEEPAEEIVPPVSTGDGEVRFEFSYDLPEAVSQANHIRIFLRAVSTSGYRFEYDLFDEDYLTTAQEWDAENWQQTDAYVVYDSKENKLELN